MSAAASKKWAEEHPDEVRAAGRRFDKKRTAKLWAFLDDYKAEGCEVCGEQDPRCLDFHHRVPEEKSFNLNVKCRKNEVEMLAELAKCAVLCANCHRKLHFHR